MSVAALLVLWLLSAPGRGLAERCSAGLVLGILNAASGSAFLRASRREGLQEGFRAGLRGIALASAIGALACAYVVLDWFLNPGSHVPFNPADLLFLLIYPVTLWGLLRMPRAERRVVGMGRILIDSVVFVVGAGLPLWIFAVKPGLASSSGFGAVVVMAYPIMIFSGILGLNIVILTRSPLPSQEAFGLLVTGIGISWLADLLFLLDSVQGFISTTAINWIDILDALALLVALVAARRIEVDKPTGADSARPPASGPLPIITIAMVSAWLLGLVTLGRVSPDVMTELVCCVVLLFVFLLLREISVMRDSDRWMAEEVQRESRARSEALVRHSSDVIMVVDAARCVRFASPAVTSALGSEAASMEDLPLLGRVHPDDQSKGQQFLERLLLTPRSLQSIQWRLRHADGSFRHFETVGSNATGESAVGGLVLNSRDVTDRVALEDQLRRTQKLQSLGQLVGGIAHNFNNILTSTMMRLDELLQRSGLSPDVVDEIRALDIEARRSADLTGKLVSFGQQQFLKVRRLDLREVVARSRAELAARLGPGVELCLPSEGAPVWVDADPTLLEQVIRSLGANAAEAMPGGGSLTLEVREIGRASLSPPPDASVEPAAYACLSLEDTGCGMDAAVRQRLFEPFFTTKRVANAMGMGLAAAHGIVRQHQGWMEVESAPGEGSTFRIYLPLAGRAVPGPGERERTPGVGAAG